MTHLTSSTLSARAKLTRSALKFRRHTGAALLAVGLASLSAPAGGQEQAATSIPFSRGFLVTGDFAIGGTDLAGASVEGFGTGTITISGVPANADILDARLYWETITLESNLSQAAGVTFRGHTIDINDGKTVSKVMTPLTGQTASCWSAGSPVAMTMFVADVLRYLPLQRDKDGRSTGKRLVNTADLPPNDPGHVVRLPKFGTGNTVPESAGATLLIVFRNADADRTANPLRAVVIYQGMHIQLPGEVTPQIFKGFYGTAAQKSARFALVAASGQKNSTEHVFFNNSKVAGEPNLPEPFPDAATSSDRGWANPTFTVTDLMPGQSSAEFGETASVSIDHKKTNPYECLTLGAAVFSNVVPDWDADGIPDPIEQAAPGSPLKDGRGALLPDLAAMGAKWDHKDIFVEVNTLQATESKTYGSSEFPYDSSATPPVTSVTHGPHTHMPSPAVIKSVGDAYANAPVWNPDETTGIRLHVDVGDIAAYRALGQIQYSDWVDDYTSTEADQYLIGATGPHVGLPTAQPRGGEVIEERACVPGDTMKCQFPAFPGTVGWKYRLQRLRDAPVDDDGGQMTATQLDAWKAGEAAPFQTYRRRFDRVRKGFFRYLLYVHARGKPKSPYPCRDGNGIPVPYDTNGTCAAPLEPNPDFRVPSSASGIADLPGYNGMVALGMWPDFGRLFLRASTTFHELGHTGYLWHGGAPAIWGNANAPTPTSTVLEANCKPNQLSSMSYAFQAHGLFRDDNPNPQIDYSRGVFGAANGSPLDETSLLDLGTGLVPGLGSSAPLYRAAWYAPWNVAGGQATRFCSGEKFPNPLPLDWTSMARFEALGATAPIYWGATPLQDINLDGCKGAACITAPAFPLTAPLAGYNEWANLLLDQMAAGRKLARFIEGEGDADFGGGDADFGAGDADFGAGDADFGGGDADFGGGDADFGAGDADFGGGDADFGGGDADFGAGDADFGAGDADFGAGGELDLQMAKGLGRTPPYGVVACVLGHNCPGPQPDPYDSLYHSIQVRWHAPILGHVAAYRLFRIYGDVVNPQTIASAVQIGPDIPGTQLAAVDNEELPDGQKFTYFLKAVFDDDVENPISGPSNFALAVARNDPPQVFADSYSIMEGAPKLTVTAPGILANDKDVDTFDRSRFYAALVTTTTNGTLTLSADGSFTYVPNPRFVGQDAFTYRANNGNWVVGSVSVPMNTQLSNIATVTITVVKKPKK